MAHSLEYGLWRLNIQTGIRNNKQNTEKRNQIIQQHKTEMAYPIESEFTKEIIILIKWILFTCEQITKTQQHSTN